VLFEHRDIKRITDCIRTTLSDQPDRRLCFLKRIQDIRYASSRSEYIGLFRLLQSGKLGLHGIYAACESQYSEKVEPGSGREVRLDDPCCFLCPTPNDSFDCLSFECAGNDSGFDCLAKGGFNCTSFTCTPSLHHDNECSGVSFDCSRFHCNPPDFFDPSKCLMEFNCEQPGYIPPPP